MNGPGLIRKADFLAVRRSYMATIRYRSIADFKKGTFNKF